MRKGKTYFSDFDKTIKKRFHLFDCFVWQEGRWSAHRPLVILHGGRCSSLNTKWSLSEADDHHWTGRHLCSYLEAEPTHWLMFITKTFGDPTWTLILIIEHEDLWWFYMEADDNYWTWRPLVILQAGWLSSQRPLMILHRGQWLSVNTENSGDPIWSLFGI